MKLLVDLNLSPKWCPLMQAAMLAASQSTVPSVVQIRSDSLDPALIGPRVLAALQELETELAQGALVTIDTNRTRAPHPAAGTPVMADVR